MTALVRYQAALLVRSQRWLPPVLLYGVIMAIGVSSGQPLLDSLAFAAAGMPPVAAWLVRVCVTNEPPAARACAAAAAGPGRVHLSSVLTALFAAGLLGAAGVAVVAVISDARTADHRHAVPLGPAITAGLLAALVSALLGTAVGALTNPPVLRRAGWAIPVSGLSALLVLVVGGSPANAAVSGLVSGSQTGAVALPLLPLCLAAAGAAAATAVACALSSRR
ncbi:ABC transporter [Streptomyces sp. SPB162]|uniref:ABC transporter n=1 Tax=Streptomyces sp. SPB162 TaxID=2940560 RepID=UPI002405DB32|nr:ABC transporter [Streptomyces sp. SPB162]MDF9816269.1 hypothetical protein [Streptomyces sp. SPB162]